MAVNEEPTDGVEQSSPQILYQGKIKLMLLASKMQDWDHSIKQTSWTLSPCNPVLEMKTSLCGLFPWTPLKPDAVLHTSLFCGTRMGNIKKVVLQNNYWLYFSTFSNKKILNFSRLV